MKKTSFTLVVALFFVSAIYASSSENKGPAEMVLELDSKENVTFPHARHQASLKDCMKCHSLFPQKHGVIEEMIGNGKLEKKQVMNHCRDCHREMKKNGKKSGPTICSKCHGN